ncbi:MAG: hypothetical protein V4525_06725 [Pseudomonadota bacterium]
MNQRDLHSSELSFYLDDSVWLSPLGGSCPFYNALPAESVEYFNHPWLPDAFWHECGFQGIS